MKAVAQKLYREPVVFLGTIQIGSTALAAADVITGWIPVVSLAIVTGLQRYFVSPKR
jgi:hypothetical protein